MSIDQWFLICGEKIQGKGEDSYLMSIDSGSTILGVFDGCGGSGAKIYPEFGGKTGAYLAARIISEATYKWYKKWILSKKMDLDGQNTSLKNIIDIALKRYQDSSQNTSVLSGSLSKEFPSTLAVAVIKEEEKHLDTSFFWSGDSRGFYIDCQGLHQVTEDDLPNSDPMVNLREDAAMNNVVSASRPYKINQTLLTINTPCVVFTASDGCYGYYRSPMEFEKIILQTLEEAHSIESWKDALDHSISKVAGDDYTMCVSIYGYGSFTHLKNAFKSRHRKLREKYSLQQDTTEEILFNQWEEYRESYEQYSRG